MKGIHFLSITKISLGTKYGTGITRALVFNISRTLLWSNAYFPVTSANPRQGSGEEKPAHSGKGGKNLFASPGVAGFFFSGKILQSKK